MSRKRCRRKVIRPLPPPGMRPKLSQAQQLDLGLVHTINLDAIARGDADAGMLWDMAGSVLTWLKAAQLSGTGLAEMLQQMDMVTRLIERYKRTGRVLFDGPDYQLAKAGVDVMDALASVVDRATAEAAAEWGERELNRIAAEVSRLQQLEEAVP